MQENNLTKNHTYQDKQVVIKALEQSFKLILNGKSILGAQALLDSAKEIINYKYTTYHKAVETASSTVTRLKQHLKEKNN